MRQFQAIVDGALRPAWRLPSGRPLCEKLLLTALAVFVAHLACLATASPAYRAHEVERAGRRVGERKQVADLLHAVDELHLVSGRRPDISSRRPDIRPNIRYLAKKIARYLAG